MRTTSLTATPAVSFAPGRTPVSVPSGPRGPVATVPAAISAAPAPAPAPATLTVDCDCCTLQGTGACEDCVVSFLLERDPDDAVVIDAEEARAMRMLERVGLLPSLRFDDRAG